MLGYYSFKERNTEKDIEMLFFSKRPTIIRREKRKSLENGKSKVYARHVNDPNMQPLTKQLNTRLLTRTTPRKGQMS